VLLALISDMMPCRGLLRLSTWPLASTAGIIQGPPTWQRGVSSSSNRSSSSHSRKTMGAGQFSAVK
jgi:hypothetical protein